MVSSSSLGFVANLSRVLEELSLIEQISGRSVGRWLSGEPGFLPLHYRSNIEIRHHPK